MVHADSIRLVRMVRTIGGQTWLHAPPTVCKTAVHPIYAEVTDTWHCSRCTAESI